MLAGWLAGGLTCLLACLLACLRRRRRRGLWGRGFYCLWDPATGRRAGCYPEAYAYNAAPADCAAANGGGGGGGGAGGVWLLVVVGVLPPVALLALVLAAALTLGHGWRGDEDESDRLLRAEVG